MPEKGQLLHGFGPHVGCTQAKVLPLSAWEKRRYDLIKQRHRPRPARRALFHLVGKTGDEKAMVGKLFQIAQLFHMAIRDFAAGLVAFPDDRWVVCLKPVLADMR